MGIFLVRAHASFAQKKKPGNTRQCWVVGKGGSSQTAGGSASPHQAAGETTYEGNNHNLQRVRDLHLLHTQVSVTQEIILKLNNT